MTIKKGLMPLAALALGLVVAVVLFSGGGTQSPDTAFAHTGTGAAHLEVDSNVNDGLGPCDPVTASQTVLGGTTGIVVAVCMSDTDQAPIEQATFDGAPAGAGGDDCMVSPCRQLTAATLNIDYDDTFVTAPDVADDLVLDLNANPDWQEGAETGGTNWDCNGLNNATSDPEGSPSPATITCNTADAEPNFLPTPFSVLALVTFDAVGAGTSSIDLTDLTNFLSGATELTCDGNLTCIDGEIEVLEAADLVTTKTCTPDPVDAVDEDPLTPEGKVTCTIHVENLGPNDAPNVFVLDNLPDDKIYVDGDSDVSCDLLDPLLVGGLLNVVGCGEIIPPITNPLSIPAGGDIDVVVVYEVPLSAAGKLETDVALAFATDFGGIIPFPPDPDLQPLIDALASVPPCSLEADPVGCAGLFLVETGLCGYPGPFLGPLAPLAPFAPLFAACDNGDSYTVDVNPADVTIEKVANDIAGQIGGQIDYTITVDVGPGSTASDVVITDTVDANQSIVSATMSVPVAACVVSGVPGTTPGNTATCTVTSPILPTDPAVTVQVVANVLDDVNNACVNNADVTFADPLTIDADPTSVVCLPPDVRMQKSADLEDDLTIEDTVNLWLCNSPVVDPDPDDDPPDVSFDDIEDLGSGAADPVTNCEYYDRSAGEVVNNGAGHLVVFERVFNALDPHGVGAFEFQVKFDHKIFDIEIFHGIDLNADGDCEDNGEDHSVETVNRCFLYQTGRVPEGADFGPDDLGDCEMTIVTENFILFGCVSKNPGDPPVETLGPIVNSDVLATLHIDPEIDLPFRLTPGQKNGVLRSILDENCELADIWGDPLATADDPETPENESEPLPGIVTGGLVDICTDLHVTTRILEGDLNMDCEVDVEDDQMIAFRYGGFFGNLLYDPWFDLEPSLKDFDIDIKDIQKVFGRNGSTCEDPLPDNQGPEAGGGFNGNPAPNPGP
jgi:uncharacterized repeat protein (TIGR01451 family)